MGIFLQPFFTSGRKNQFDSFLTVRIQSVTVPINVTIPRRELYTLYAEGVLLSEDFTEDGLPVLEFDENAVLILYYKFMNHRRIYICFSEKSGKTPGSVCVNTFPDVDGGNRKMSVVRELRGRPYDRFKKYMKWLSLSTEGKIYRMSPAFFWQLAVFCTTKKVSRELVKMLVLRYEPSLTFKEILWKQTTK